MDINDIGKALQSHFDKLGLRQVDIAEKLGVSKAYINSLFTGKRPFGKKQAELWESKFGISRVFLLSGEGPMLVNEVEGDSHDMTQPDNRVPLIPASAFAGSVRGFAPDSALLKNCEKIVSPVMGAEYAIPITGDSMEPDYPDGAIAYIRSINDEAFIPWGHTVILDTENGAFIKKIYPDEQDQKYVWAKSINPAYPPLHIPKFSIFRMFRVLGTSRIFTTM